MPPNAMGTSAPPHPHAHWARTLLRRLGRLKGFGPTLMGDPLGAIPLSLGDPQATALAELRGQLITYVQTQQWSALHQQLAIWDRAHAQLPDGRRMARLAAALLILPAQPNPTNCADAFETRAHQWPQHSMAAALAGLALLHQTQSPPADRLSLPLQFHTLQGSPVARATRLLDPLDPAEHQSPLLAQAQFHLALALQEPVPSLHLTHEDWADLCPGDPMVWHSLGVGLAQLPYVSGRSIAAAADRAAWHGTRWFGQGGYALVTLAALGLRPDLWPHIDGKVFLPALHDLLRQQAKQQYGLNALAAQLTHLSLRDPTIAPLAEATKMTLLAGLRELHPHAWGLPPDEIRRRIAAPFAQDLAKGAELRYDGGGLRLLRR